MRPLSSYHCYHRYRDCKESVLIVDLFLVLAGTGAGHRVLRASFPPEAVPSVRRLHHRLRTRIPAQFWGILCCSRSTRSALRVQSSGRVYIDIHDRVCLRHRCYQGSFVGILTGLVRLIILLDCCLMSPVHHWCRVILRHVDEY